jgi:hypothetical protein
MIKEITNKHRLVVTARVAADTQSTWFPFTLRFVCESENVNVFDNACDELGEKLLKRINRSFSRHVLIASPPSAWARDMEDMIGAIGTKFIKQPLRLEWVHSQRGKSKRSTFIIIAPESAMATIDKFIERLLNTEKDLATILCDCMRSMKIKELAHSDKRFKNWLEKFGFDRPNLQHINIDEDDQDHPGDQGLYDEPEDDL